MAKSLIQHMQKRNAMQLKNGGGPGDGGKKKEKNYNYKAAEKKELEENPSALGTVSEAKSRQIEESYEGKRKEWARQHSKGQMTKGALQDSIASTLADPRKAKDLMPAKVKMPKKRKKAGLAWGNNPFW